MSSSSNGTALQNAIDHALIGAASTLPSTAPTPNISISPLSLHNPTRLLPNLQFRISFPSTISSPLPLILLSHGQGRSNNLSSLHGYGPLVSHWSSHSFIVIQPTHLSSKSLSLPAETPDAPLFWRSRVEDMSFILDNLDKIESLVPMVVGKIDREKVAVVGHSMGGHTASMLLGATLTDPDTREVISLVDKRVKAGILLTAPGNGGASLSKLAYDNYPFFREPSYAPMGTQALVVMGEDDGSEHLCVAGKEWHVDPYTYGSGKKALLRIEKGGHCLGGISGWDVAESADDESPERVAIVQRITTAYLRGVFLGEEKEWKEVGQKVQQSGLGSVEEKA